jgi:hypothetical protein
MPTSGSEQASRASHATRFVFIERSPFCSIHIL